MESLLASLVIPCYNEGDNVPLLVERLTSLQEQSSDLEFLIVDNGSTDGTSGLFIDAAASHKHIRTVRVEKKSGIRIWHPLWIAGGQRPLFGLDTCGPANRPG